jgi:hypothetical protein
MARQDKKTEQLKARFGKKNSIIVYPNEKPKYEYRVKISPQISKNTEYTIKIDYRIKKLDVNCTYKIEFTSSLPSSGKLMMRITGAFSRSDIFDFNRYSIDDESNLSYSITSKDLGEVNILK